MEFITPMSKRSVESHAAKSLNRTPYLKYRVSLTHTRGRGEGESSAERGASNPHRIRPLLVVVALSVVLLVLLVLVLLHPHWKCVPRVARHAGFDPRCPEEWTLFLFFFLVFFFLFYHSSCFTQFSGVYDF